MAQFGWEGWGEAWEEENFDPDEGPNELDKDFMTETDYGDQLAKMLVDLKTKGVISATQCCTLAYYASKGGCKGKPRALSKNPNAFSGGFSRHFDRFTGAGAWDLDTYDLPLGKKDQYEGRRHWVALPFLPPHEAMRDELRRSDYIAENLRQALSTRSLPQKYYNHPIVQQAGDDELVHPIVLYLDGVEYSRPDTILAMTAYFLFSGDRHLIFSIRKSEMCNCGCRGQCSLDPLFRAVGWSFKAMCAGIFPSCRHDGSAWVTPNDTARASYQGLSLGFKAVCLYVKTDWAELVHTLGFPSWQDSFNPCAFCFSPWEEMGSFRGFSALRMPHAPKTAAHYAAACTNAEVWVDLSSADIAKIRANLYYEKRSGHRFRGRVLSVDMDEHGLKKGDRLEPTHDFPDVGRFVPEQAPRRAKFWRSTEQTSTRWRNPIFDEGTGVDLNCLCFDWLHTLSLGVFQVVCGHVVQELLAKNPFGFAGAIGENLLKLGIARVSKELKDFIKSELVAKGHGHTRVPVVKNSSFGTPAEPELKFLGAQTNTFLRFCHQVLLPRFGASLGERLVHFNAAIKSCVEVLDLIRDHDYVMPPEQNQQFCNAVRVHLRSIHALGIGIKPKHHGMMEMARAIRTDGSPAITGCWDDESENKGVKQIARRAHEAVFHQRMLSTWAFVSRRGSKRRSLD